jgi:glycosyltransferase involved in cell wall biosynthesis
MRILAITSRFPRPAAPTAALFSRWQWQALARIHQVRAIVPVSWVDRLKDRLKGRGSAKPLEFGALQVRYSTFWFPPRIVEDLQGHFYLASLRPAVNRLLKGFMPDAVMAVWSHPDGWAAVKIARELGVPCFIKVIGSDVLVLSRKKRRRERVAEALRDADGVIAVSHDLARHVGELGVDASRIHVVSEGTDRNLFRPGDQSAARQKLGVPTVGRMLLFVGNLLYSKGAGLLIEACAILRDNGHNFICNLVGDGADAQKLRQLTASLKLNDRVYFPGRVAQDRLPDWYQACDVVTLPSYSEGIPNCLREAMCCGKPFVATRVGGISEISPPGCSRLVKHGDAQELAEALAEMLQSPPQVGTALVDSLMISWDQSAALIDGLLRGSFLNKLPKSSAVIAEDSQGAQLRVERQRA